MLLIRTGAPNAYGLTSSSRCAEGVNIRKEPQMRDKEPSQITLEGVEPQLEAWPRVVKTTPESQRVVYPGAGSELFHGKRTS